MRIPGLCFILLENMIKILHDIISLGKKFV
jgi:hypothetical protein